MPETLTRSEKAREYFKNVAENYDKLRDHKIGRAERSIVYAYLSNFRKAKTLELGCGTGDYPLYVDPYYYIGIDNCQQMTKQAREKIEKLNVKGCKFYTRDARFIDLRSEREKFKFIVSTFNGVGYTDDHYSLASEIFNYLRPGGRFYLMLPGPGMARNVRPEEKNGPELFTYTTKTAPLFFTNGGTMKIISSFPLNINGDKLAKYLPGFFLRFYLILESIIARRLPFLGLADKARYIVLEGFRPLPLEDRAKARAATLRESWFETIRKAVKSQKNPKPAKA